MNLRRQQTELIERLMAIRDRTERMAVLEDWPAWLRLLRLRTEKTRGVAWFDPAVTSPYWVMHNAVEDAIDGRDKVGIFGPRGIGKSESIIYPQIVKEIIKHPDRTHLIGSETMDLAKPKLKWVRDRLEMLEPVFGPMKTDEWTADRFTVRRPQGGGGQATLVAWGPQSTQVGVHPHYVWLDDLHGELGARSAELVDMVREAVVRMSASWLPETIVTVTGTFWPYNTFYRRMLQDPALKGMFKMVILSSYDDRSNIQWPVYTKEYLDRQRQILGPALFAGQFLMQHLDGTQLCFSPSMFQGRVALPPDKTVMQTYMTVDPAWGTVRGSSESAVFVGQMTSDEQLYIVDGAMGRFGADQLVSLILEKCRKWAPYHYTMELQGPGGLYPSHIRMAAQKMGMPPPVPRPVKRKAQARGKIARISLCIPHMGRVWWSPQLDPQFFRVTSEGRPTGRLGDQFMAFDATNPVPSWDGLDAFADFFGDDEDGPYCPVPRVRTERPEMTWRERSLQKILGEGEEDGEVMR